MFDRSYRQRLEVDLARWEADGLITPAALKGIRSTLPSLSPGVSIPVAVAIVGGLFVAAAFLVFIAAHWTELPRLLRFVIVIAGLVAANGLGFWFAHTHRPILADLCASVSAIIFGAGIALVGQMYHLGEDFAGGMLLWSVGAMVTAALTGSQGALAVALSAANIWVCLRIDSSGGALHPPFLALWFIGTCLALAWNSRVAAHLVAVASFPYWIAAVVQPFSDSLQPAFVLADGAALLFGCGLALAAMPWQRALSFGAVLSNYGAISLAGATVLEVATVDDLVHLHADVFANQPPWALSCGAAGAILAFVAAAFTRRAGTISAGIAIALVLVTALAWLPRGSGESWLAYALMLGAMLCLIVSGMLDAATPRIVAGWLGIAGVIMTITWVVKGSLLRRSAFLAVAGAAAVGLATALHRLMPRADK